MKRNLIGAALAAAGVLGSQAALATDGYFQHGYGMKSKGRGGASTAMTTDAYGGASNPATMVFVGNRVELGIDWFRPDRSARREGSAGGAGFLDGSADGNESQNFFIPEFAFNYMLQPKLSLGVTVYANGGMNTDYKSGQLDQGVCQMGPPSGVPANLLCGSGQLGVNLEQLIIAPTLAYKVADKHSIGVSPLIAYQKFKAYGLQPFGAISSSPSDLTNNGHDTSWGYGLRIGYYGEISRQFSVGVAYSTKISMGEFDKYKGLFAEQGGFDIPENYSLGVAFKPSDKLTIAADYQRINYNKVNSVGNPSNQPGCMPTMPAGPGVGAACLGASSSSIGFGWDNIDVWKLGVEYQWNQRLTLRGGYNHSDNPIQARDVTFNILAPGVIEDHVTLGFTYQLEGNSEITMAYMHGFKNSVSGPATNPYFNVGGTETIEMSQDSLGIAWAKRY
ncbi:MAG: long-chain fatty acid transporter [Betaproteobacteria bacterium SG8_39]|nr:MAG: long-chain fatty acid transporter [Betaproteobacteria bacterium SG8_39]